MSLEFSISTFYLDKTRKMRDRRSFQTEERLFEIGEWLFESHERFFETREGLFEIEERYLKSGNPLIASESLDVFKTPWKGHF